jgi:hypothetical protein
MGEVRRESVMTFLLEVDSDQFAVRLRRSCVFSFRSSND